MDLIKPVILALCCLCIGLYSFTQDIRNNESRRLLKEDRYEFYLEKSKRLKFKAIGAAVVGPVLTGIGFYLIMKEHTRVSQSANGIMYGKFIAGTGLMTTVSCIPLFISSGKAKREAKLVLTDESTSYFSRKVSVRSIGLHLNL